MNVVQLALKQGGTEHPFRLRLNVENIGVVEGVPTITPFPTEAITLELRGENVIHISVRHVLTAEVFEGLWDDCTDPTCKVHNHAGTAYLGFGERVS